MLEAWFIESVNSETGLPVRINAKQVSHIEDTGPSGDSCIVHMNNGKEIPVPHNGEAFFNTIMKLVKLQIDGGRA